MTQEKAILALEAALQTARKYVGCGDNSCRFVTPGGMATNGGCRCIEHARPGVHPSLGMVFRAAERVVTEWSKEQRDG